MSIRLSPFLTTTAATLAMTVLLGLFGVLSSRALGPHERGLLATAVVWTSLLAWITSAGLPQAITYHVSRFTDAAHSYAATGLVMVFAGGLTLSVTGVTGALMFAPNRVQVSMAILFGATLPFMVAGAGIAAILGTGAYRAWGLLRIAGPVLAVAGLGVGLSLGSDTAQVVAWVIGISSLVHASIVVLTLGRRGLLGGIDRGAARKLASYGWRQVASLITWLLNLRLDQLVLSIAVTPAALGLYATAASFGELIAPVASSAGSVMLVRAAAGGRDAALASLPRALVTCSVIGCAMIVPTFLLADDLLELLFGEAFRPAADVLRILLVGTLGLALASVLADTLRGLGHPLDTAKAELVACGVTLVLLIALVPAYGIRGAAIASAVSYNSAMVVMAVFVWYRMKRVVE